MEFNLIHDQVFLKDEGKEYSIYFAEPNRFKAVNNKDNKDVKHFIMLKSLAILRQDFRQQILEYTLGRATSQDEVYPIDIFLQGQFITEMEYCAETGKPIEEYDAYYQINDDKVLEGYQDDYCNRVFGTTYQDFFDTDEKDEDDFDIWSINDRVYYSEMQY